MQERKSPVADVDQNLNSRESVAKTDTTITELTKKKDSNCRDRQTVQLKHVQAEKEIRIAQPAHDEA